MNFESIKNSIRDKLKNADKIILENDIHETIPKPVAKTMVRFGSLPGQLKTELNRAGINLKEDIYSATQELVKNTPKQKISDHEIRYLSQTLSKLRQLPVTEKEQKLKDIKESLAWFKIEAGKAEDKIIKDLLNNPPASKEDAFKRIENHLRHLPLSFNDYGAIMAISDSFYQRHKDTLETRAVKTDSEIFNLACGSTPSGEIEVMTTPLGFYIRAHDLGDYAKLWYADDDESLSPVEKKSRMISVNKSGGFKRGALTTENAQGKFFLGYPKTVYDHEEQHAVYGLMKFEIGDVWNTDQFTEQIQAFWSKKNSEDGDSIEDIFGNRKEARGIVEDLYNKRLSYVLDRGKDEVLAYMIDRDRTAAGIYDLLTDPDGLYNYYEKQKSALVDIDYIGTYDISIPESIQTEISKHEDWLDQYNFEEEYKRNELVKIYEYFDTFKEDVGWEIFVDKYHKILAEGISAFEDLKESGLKRDVIVRILSHEPLDKWPKVAKRIIEQRK